MYNVIFDPELNYLLIDILKKLVLCSENDF
jgi:hypothetical protein